MNKHNGTEVSMSGFAVKADPDSRVADAVFLHVRKRIGLKWYVDAERTELIMAVSRLPSDDQKKVRLVKSERPSFSAEEGL